MHKVKRARIYFILVLTLLVQLTVLDRLKIFGAMPDMMLSYVIFLGIFQGSAMGMESGLVAGFLKDIFALDLFGMNTFVFCVTGFVVGALNTKFFKESKIIQVLLVFSFTIIAAILHFALARIFLRTSLGLFDYLASSALPAGLYTAIISVPLFPILINIFKLKEESNLL